MFLLVLSLAGTVFANGLSLNSPGPRALAMGGAFVGLANDGSAIYWNPAGLAGQESAIKLIATDIIPLANYQLAAYGIDTEAEMIHYLGPNMFFNYLMGDLALGLGVFVPAGIGTEWDGADLLAFAGPPQIDLLGDGSLLVTNPYAGKEFEWMSKIAVIDISPAVAYQISDKVSLGVAANIYYGMLELKRGEDQINILANYGVPADGMLDTQSAFDVSGLGYGGSLGLMYRASERFSLGLSYKTPVNVKFEGDGTFDLPGLTDPVDSELEIEWPTWIGAGMAFYATENLTFTADAQYSNWKSLEKIDITIQLPEAYGGEKEEELELKWENAIQWRLGWEYKATPCLALRGGYYYDPAPAPDETLNFLFPSSTNSVLTGGFGYSKGKFDLDFGLEYLFGMERNIAASGHNMPGKHSLDVFAFSLGLGYRF